MLPKATKAHLVHSSESLAQLGSAGLLSKVPVFHGVCSTSSHTQTARCNIRMEVKHRACLAKARENYVSCFLLPKATKAHLVHSSESLEWMLSVYSIVDTTLMCVRESSRKLI